MFLFNSVLSFLYATCFPHTAYTYESVWTPHMCSYAISYPIPVPSHTLPSTFIPKSCTWHILIFYVNLLFLINLTSFLFNNKWLDGGCVYWIELNWFGWKARGNCYWKMKTCNIEHERRLMSCVANKCNCAEDEWKRVRMWSF